MLVTLKTRFSTLLLKFILLPEVILNLKCFYTKSTYFKLIIGPYAGAESSKNTLYVYISVCYTITQKSGVTPPTAA